MREVKQYELVEWPSAELCESFSFEANATAGIFTFYFKWINNRWNCWVTLPDGTKREAGVQPNIHNWTGFSEYGLYFKTDLNNINYNSLFLTELYILTWL